MEGGRAVAWRESVAVTGPVTGGTAAVYVTQP